jgi:hypothetical protein
MYDVSITKGQHRAYAIGTTQKGKTWLRDNVIGTVETISVSISLSVTDEFKIDLEKEGLKVEIR